ncbi:ABC transporter ATP-binding protein [Rathayibacter sp. ZW T2_19]|uniref:ABC transporter ATP-binding protein n=1 Tax=Rathayibacter rubneri TaxID=2950106 RepID=A0A9X2DXR9_9MICO|nr:ABC transporter ATP-binding protein [Rathayibacter rubneri]MCM6762579.1 ABC transporter ATP-binding protein [Rathayibacter rubneri]
MDILEVDGITKSYGAGTVLADVSLAIAEGVVHGLLGPNGSGKSTGLHILTGLIEADRGTVRIRGVDISRKPSRRHVGFAPDDLPLPDSLTGTEYLSFHDAMRSRDDRARSRVLVEALGLSADLDKQVGRYSHGMKRKIQIVAALAHEPDLLVLDEPFRGLDPDAASVLGTVIRSFAASGRAVLLATHDLLRAERDCDDVTVLHRGRVLATGAPRSLIGARPRVQDLEGLFLELTGTPDARRDRLLAVATLFAPPRGRRTP